MERTQKYLNFRNFYNTHFLANRKFFEHALNPTPSHLWNINDVIEQEPADSNEMKEEVEEHYTKEENEYHQDQDEYYQVDEHYQEEDKIEFVLSEEAIAMFRFSELRRLDLENATKSNSETASTSNYLVANDDSSQIIYSTSEPDPSLISTINTSDIRKLYGDSYNTILILEGIVNNDFVQSFQTHDDNHEVVYWPVIPLRFT
nr:13724_t:CDS:2 [Entrophospora candida]